MNRDRLARWLRHPYRAWRWHDGDNDRYEAVETLEEGLSWYRWTHEFGAAPEAERHAGGERDRFLQRYEDFLAGGPPRPVPDEIAAEVRSFVLSQGLGSEDGASGD